MTTSIDQIYAEMEQIDQGDPVKSAVYREHAQDIITTTSIPLKIRMAIAEQLSQINQRLALQTAGSDDSY